MNVERRHEEGRVARVPRPTPDYLTPEQRRRFHQALEKIEADRVAWAKLVRRFGLSACARELAITPQALSSRLKRIEEKARNRVGFVS